MESFAFGLFVVRYKAVRGVGARLRPWCYAPLGPLAGANGQAAGRRRHSVSRPANTPHRQQRGAGAVEGQSTAKPQLAAPKGGKGPQGLSEASGPVPRRARRRLGLPAPLRSGFRGGVRVFRAQSESKPRSKQQVFSGVDTDTGQRVAKQEALQHRFRSPDVLR